MQTPQQPIYQEPQPVYYMQGAPQQVNPQPEVQVNIPTQIIPPHEVVTEFTPRFALFAAIYRGLNVAISLGFLLFGFTLCSKILGDEAELATKKPLKGGKSLFLVLLLYVVFFIIGLGIIPGLVDWAPALVYLYIGQPRKSACVLILRFFYFLGLIPQMVVFGVIGGLVSAGVGSIVSALFGVLWHIIMFIFVKGCLFDQFFLVRTLNRGEEIHDTEFASQNAMLLSTFGMINQKFACIPVKDKKTTLCVTKY